PVKPDSLLLKLRYYLTRYEEELTDTEREPGKTTQGVEEEMATDSLEQYIKLDEALARLKDNKTLYKTLLNTFRKSTYWDQLQRQIADQDFAEAAKTAHAIKGMSANLSLVEIYQKVALLESQLKSGFDFSETLAQLEHAMEQTTKYIKILAEKL
ncbi:MAG: Hpt domain-containing protein, partial [Peptococcaceae bacterium]|nr:Hpt domain-containing protein [Peptococcaceae bacterium]